jgi:DNA primase
MSFPPGFLDELRTRLPLSETIAQRISLTRAGREFKGCCPFHNEKTPSFYVNDQKGFFHCFGCGAHGDIIGFVMRHDRLGFVEAIENLAQLASLEVPRISREEAEKASKQKTLHQLCEAACAFFEQQLRGKQGRTAFDYLKGRGLADEAMARFRLGYAPAEGGALVTHLKQLGYELPQMMEVGLVRKSEQRGDHYSFFRDRVMFPVTDRRGRVVAFGGRIMSGDGPKYINSPDHPLFHKGKLLYSLPRAAEAASRKQPVIVVEGYMDVISLVEAGFAGAVAPLGTALTEDQMEELWKLGAADPILCFDGDNAGQRAASRSLERALPLLGPSRSLRFAFITGGAKDPDDLIKAGGAPAMQLVLDQAISLTDMLWKVETEGKNFTTPEARAGLKQALATQVEKMTDAAVQTFYRTEFAKRIDAAYGWKSLKNQPRKPVSSGVAILARSLPRNPDTQRQRLALVGLLRQPQLFERLSEELVALNLTGPLDNLWQAVVSTLETSPDFDSAALRSCLYAKGFEDTVHKLLGEFAKGPVLWAREGAASSEVERGLRGLVTMIRMQTAKAELQAAIRNELSEADLVRIAALRREVIEAEAALQLAEEEMA